MDQDNEHLKLLAIFHYVAAGMAAVFACIPFIHFSLGLALATGAFPDTDPEGRTVGAVMAAVAGFLILMGWLFAALVALCGRSIQKRQRYTFCLIMAGIECLFMPVGTVLGVFTIIVLLRDSVKEQFGLAVHSDESVPDNQR
jgi:hypothetical protein